MRRGSPHVHAHAAPRSVVATGRSGHTQILFRHIGAKYGLLVQALMLYLVGSAEGPPAASPLLPPAVPLPLDALLSAAGLLSLAQRALPLPRLPCMSLRGNNHALWLLEL